MQSGELRRPIAYLPRDDDYSSTTACWPSGSRPAADNRAVTIPKTVSVNKAISAECIAERLSDSWLIQLCT
jgi:hypothetical protein